MGLLRDAYWLRTYLNAKAKSDLIDALDDVCDTKKTKGREKCAKSAHAIDQKQHLGFWDFLDKQIQEEKKEERENPQSIKEILKYFGILILGGGAICLMFGLFVLLYNWLCSLSLF